MTLLDSKPKPLTIQPCMFKLTIGIIQIHVITFPIFDIFETIFYFSLL